MSGVQLTYFLMTIVPTALLGVMLFLGLDSGSDVDMDIGGDVDIDVGMDANIDIGDLDGGPGVFSLRLILAFVIGFGLGGFLAIAYNWFIPHWLVGIIGGLTIYFLVYLLLRLLYNQQSSTQISHLSQKGRKATVSIAIQQGKVGQIKVSDVKTGLTSYMTARSYVEDEEFRKNEVVIVKSITGGVAKVISAEIDLN